MVKVQAVIFDCFGVIQPLTSATVDKELLVFIEELHKDYKTAVLSNAGKGRLTEVIGQKEAERCFDVLVESGTTGFAKPDLEIYKYTSTLLGVLPEDCVFTDDSQDFCDAARRAGMQSIRYGSLDQFKLELLKLLQK